MGLFGRKKAEPRPPPVVTPVAAKPDADSMFETIFNMKYTAKQLGRMSKKSESKVAGEKRKCKEAIEKGNIEGAKIFAENAIRLEKESISYLRLQSRLEAVVSRLEGQATMQTMMGSMEAMTKGLGSALESMDMMKVAEVMDQFEEQFEELDVRGKYMDGAISDSMASSTPQSEVNQLLQQVAEEHQLKLGADLMVGTSQIPTNRMPQQPSSTKVEDPLQDRLEQLKKGL